MGTLNTFDFQGTPSATVAGTGITLQGTGQAIYVADSSMYGTTAAQFTANDGLTKAARCALAVASKTYSVDLLMKTSPSLPASGQTKVLAAIRHASGVLWRIVYDSAGQICLSAGGSGVIGVSATGFPVNTPFRFSSFYVSGSATVTPFDGSITAKVYTAASNFTVQSGSTLTSSTLDLGVATTAAIDVGALSAITPGQVMIGSLIRAEDGRTTEIGAPPAPGATTAVAGVNNADVEVDTTVTLSAAGSTGSGALSYAWTCIARPEGAAQPAITTPNASTAAATVTTNGTYTFRVTVNGTGGASTADVSVYAYPHTNLDVLIASLDASTWTLLGAAATSTIAVNDTDQTTGMQSPDVPSVSTPIKGTFRPAGPGSFTFRPEGYYPSGSGPATIHCKILNADESVTFLTDGTAELLATNTTLQFDVPDSAISGVTVASGGRRAWRFWLWAVPHA